MPTVLLAEESNGRNKYFSGFYLLFIFTAENIYGSMFLE